MKSVLIVGSGLLGLSLAEKFNNNGYKVSITTTTESKLLQLQHVGYNSIMFDSNVIEHYKQLSLIKVDVLIFALAPSKCKVISYTDVLSNICNSLHSFSQLVFTSSISVYSNNKQTLTEASEAIELNSIIYQTESYIKQHIKLYYIFRLAGLIDKQRHPKNFHKSSEVKEADAPVNLVHIQDVSNIIFASVTNKINDGVYNVCSPVHPTKKEYYGSFNELLKFSEGDFGKTIDGSLISNQLNYKYTSIYNF
jgi:nucleoside-diphosphate-sugar epimerase